MKKEFSVPSIETRGLMTEGVMAGDLAIFSNSPGRSMVRNGVAIKDNKTPEVEKYEAWKGLHQ